MAKVIDRKSLKASSGGQSMSSGGRGNKGFFGTATSDGGGDSGKIPFIPKSDIKPKPKPELGKGKPTTVVSSTVEEKKKP